MSNQTSKNRKQIIRNLRKYVWLRSKERSEKLKEYNYCCAKCKIKQTRRKGKEVVIDVHHIKLINWDRILKVLYEELLHTNTIPLCPSCHKREHIENEFEEINP